MAAIVDLGQAVLALVTTPTTAAGGTAVRAWAPRQTLDEMGATLVVTVVPRTEDRTRLRRAAWRQDLTVDVAVQQRVTTDAEVDDLVDWVEELADLLAAAPTIATAQLETVKVRPVCDADGYDTMGLFTSVIELTYTQGRT